MELVDHERQPSRGPIPPSVEPDEMASGVRLMARLSLIERRMSRFLREPISVRSATNVIRRGHTDRGLEEALRALAGRTPVATTVTAVGLGRYTPEIESAVYFCCVEALQNVAKHALDARSATISVVANGTLDFEVRDDGGGFAESAPQREQAEPPQ